MRDMSAAHASSAPSPIPASSPHLSRGSSGNGAPSLFGAGALAAAHPTEALPDEIPGTSPGMTRLEGNDGRMQDDAAMIHEYRETTDV